MPYISSELVKEKRNQLKKAFPKYKFSVRTVNNSTISVSIMSGPIDLLPNKENKHEQVNVYYIDEHYKNDPKTLKMLKRIYEIINSGNRTIVEDGDYGSIPKFYTDINIGKWDKNYIIK